MKDNKLNILFLASWYPNSESSQAGNFIQQHARAVSEYVNVAVVHVVPVANQKTYKITNEWNNGIYEVIVYYNKTKSSAPILSKKQKGKRQQTAYLKGYDIALREMNSFDMVHLNVVYPAGLFALYLNKKHQIPFILTEHWTAFQKTSKNSFSSLEKYFIKKISKKASKICPVSENLKNEMIQFGIDSSYQVIPNVVNTEIFRSGLKKEERKQIGILHISNLKDEHKNISGILRVIKKLSEKRKDFRLTIAGNGDVEKFRIESNELNIPKEVIHFEDEKTPFEVAQLMDKNDLFLLFSNYENLPCVIAESLVMGLPVISTDVGGISEMINESNGILIHPGKEEELHQELNQLIDSISEYDNEKIANQGINIYGYQQVGKAYFEIYKSLLN